jgi:hypothetical protein
MTENELRNYLILHLRQQGIEEIEIEIQEPAGCRVADLVYIKNREIHVIEVKKCFNKKLLQQAKRWKYYTPLVWVLVISRGRKNIDDFFDNGIGVIIWNNNKFDIVSSPDGGKDQWFITENRKRLKREEKLIENFKWVQQQKEETKEQRCYHSFKCKCGKEVFMGSIQYVKLYRDDLGMFRALRCCYDCGKEWRKELENV